MYRVEICRNQTDIRGLELGFEWLLNDDWFVGANYALNDAEFSDAMSFGVLPLNGFQRPRVSRHALNARLQYSKELKENWGSKTSLNVVYNSSRRGNAESAIETGDQLDVNFRTSLTKNNLEFSLWTDNVLDDKTPSNAIDSFSFGEPGYITFLPRGRQAGVSINYSF